MGGLSSDRIKGVYVVCLNSENSFQLGDVKTRKFTPYEISQLIKYGNNKNQYYCICVDIIDFYDSNEPPLSKSSKLYKVTTIFIKYIKI